MPQQQQYQPPPVAPTGMFYNNSIPPQQPQQMPPQAPQQFMAAEQPRVARREMKGPSGVDDILKTFEEVRRAETEPMFNPFGTGTSPSGMAAVDQQPAVTAAVEMQSVMTGDVASMGEADGSGRRRRRKGQPIGNSVTLNV